MHEIKSHRHSNTFLRPTAKAVNLGEGANAEKTASVQQ